VQNGIRIFLATCLTSISAMGYTFSVAGNSAGQQTQTGENVVLATCAGGFSQVL